MSGIGAEPMEPFTTHTGLVAPLDRVDVDTDQIIPKQFLKRIERTGYGRFLFNDWRTMEDGSPNPDFALNRPEFGGSEHPRGRPQLRVRLVSRARPLGT